MTRLRWHIARFWRWWYHVAVPCCPPHLWNWVDKAPAEWPGWAEKAQGFYCGRCGMRAGAINGAIW
jgi:hypothetical protein